MAAKTPKESLTIVTDIVLPGETNPLDNLFGGELLARMDRASSIAARRHSNRIVVTAAVNQCVNPGGKGFAFLFEFDGDLCRCVD